MKGYFLTVEGAEGSGKTSLVKQLKHQLTEEFRIPVLTFKEPGAAYSGQLRELLLSGKACPMSELMLFLADRAQNISLNIKPALDNGIWVIVDRFSDSTIIYQSIAKQVVDSEVCKNLCKLAEQGVQPDQTIVVRSPFYVCQDRLSTRQETPRLAQQSGITTEMKVWQAYQTFGHRSLEELRTVKFFDNNESIEALTSKVIAEGLSSFIEDYKSA